MTKIQPFARKSMIAVASLAIAGAALCTYSARADDPKMEADHKMMMAPKPLSPEDQKIVMDHMDKMATMIADPKDSEKMTADWARMMVMDEMARSIAMDPAFQKKVAEMGADPAVKKMGEDAKKMAEDPEQMKKMKEEIMADPKAMKAVIHQAVMMSMMHDHMMDKMDDMKK